MSNLPEWTGADSVYRKLQKANEILAAQSHKIQYDLWRMKGKGKYKFTVPDDVKEIIEAMNEGNEERCKGLLQLKHIQKAYYNSK